MMNEADIILPFKRAHHLDSVTAIYDKLCKDELPPFDLSAKARTALSKANTTLAYVGISLQDIKNSEDVRKLLIAVMDKSKQDYLTYRLTRDEYQSKMYAVTNTVRPQLELHHGFKLLLINLDMEVLSIEKPLLFEKGILKFPAGTITFKATGEDKRLEEVADDHFEPPSI